METQINREKAPSCLTSHPTFRPLKTEIRQRGLRRLSRKNQRPRARGVPSFKIVPDRRLKINATGRKKKHFARPPVGSVGRRKVASIRGLTTIKWRNKGRRRFAGDNARSSGDRNELRLVLKSPLLPTLDDERYISNLSESSTARAIGESLLARGNDLWPRLITRVE